MAGLGNISITEKPTTIVVIPDLHDCPKTDTTRLKWIARFINDYLPDHIIQIGDILDMESLCSHVPNDTVGGKLKPHFMADIESLAHALDDFKKTLTPAAKKIPRHITLGNHEHRCWLWEKYNPEVAGMFQHALTSVLEASGWTYTMYGEYYTVAGVDFTHVPLNGLGKPYGGKTAITRIANESMADIVYGHTHKFEYRSVTKLGPNRGVTAINVGCALEWGVTKDYTGYNPTDWWWGIVTLTIKDGRIVGFQQIPMFELEENYHDKQARK